MEYVLPVVISYLLGSITFSYLMGKLLKGIDIREHGSGNAGATNTLRVLGTIPGILVLLLDMGKGAAAVLIAKFVAPEAAWIHVISALAAVSGHTWPVFLKFKGGKGVATTIGAVAALTFFPTLYAGLIAIVIIALTRYVSLGSLLLTLLLPVFIWIAGDAMPYFYLSLLMAILVWYRHRSNIVKLLNGTENRIGKSKNIS